MYNFDDRHARGWRRFEQFAKRGFGGFPGFGMNFDGLEGNFRIGKMLASGDLRLVALFLIEQQPRHGYDLIKAVEEKTGGFYSPSPGIVYPALTFLEEAGFITSATEGNKKSYSITDDGRAHLASNRAAVESTLDYLGKIGRRWAEMRQGFGRHEHPGDPGDGQHREHREERREYEFEHRHEHDHQHGHDHRHAHGPGYVPGDIPGVIDEVNLARRALTDAIRSAARGNEETQRRLAAVMEKAARKIRDLGDKPQEPEVDV